MTRYTKILLPLILLWLIGCMATAEVVQPTNESQPLDIKTGTSSESMTFDGITRSYVVHVPEQVPLSEPVPLLLNLHGLTGTAESQMAYADFRAIADREGFVVIYPEGTLLGNNTHWNVEGLFERFGVDSMAADRGFLSALIELAVVDLNVDESRVYAIGHSNGGYMSIDLACQIGDQLTAVASVAGTMTPEVFEACQPTHPTPLLQIHGTSDNVVPYDGDTWTKSVDEVLAYWIEVNGVSSEPVIIDVPQNGETTQDSQVVRLQFRTAEEEVLVEHIMVENGKHDWPGQAPFPQGPVNLDLEFNEEIWAFLSQFDLDDLD